MNFINSSVSFNYTRARRNDSEQQRKGNNIISLFMLIIHLKYIHFEPVWSWRYLVLMFSVVLIVYEFKYSMLDFT